MADDGLVTYCYLAICREPFLLKVCDRGRFDLNGLKPFDICAFKLSDKGDKSAFPKGPFLPAGLVAVIANERLLVFYTSTYIRY